MFLAGNVQIVEQSQSWNQQPTPGKSTLALPDSLRSQEASLEISTTPQGNDAVQVTMTARIAKHASRQELSLKRGGEKWQITSARLIQ